MNYKSGLGVGLMAVLIGVLMIGSSTAAAANATMLQARNAPVTASSTSCTYLTFLFYGTTYSGNESEWSCALHATDVNGTAIPLDGWSNTIFEAICSGSCNFHLTISDVGFYGDYYSLWETTDSTFATEWGQVGTTPEVATGPQLNASSYNSHWTGLGTTYSHRTFDIYLPGSTAFYFAVHDDLMSLMKNKLAGPCGVSPAKLLTSGCTASGISVASGWSPASFTLSIAGAP